jgi:hypothetical protein
VSVARRLRRHFAEGGAVLHFPAGAIEPDPAFLRSDEAALGPWQPGLGWLSTSLAAADGCVVPTIVRAVHSRRAKRLQIVRWAESRGITTLAPLLSVAVPGFSDVSAEVRFGDAKRARELLGAPPLPLSDRRTRVIERLRQSAAELLV